MQSIRIIAGVIFACLCTVSVAQNRVVLNEAGGTTKSNDIMAIISPQGQFNVFYKGFRQSFSHTERPAIIPIDYSNYGSSPVIRFKFSLPGKTTGSDRLTAITPCSITPVQGAGTLDDPQRTTLTGTVTSPLTQQVYNLTCSFMWGGDNRMYMYFVIRAPFNLKKSEKLHLYIDEDLYVGDDDNGFALTGGDESSQYVGGYRVNDNCIKNNRDTRLKTCAYGYKVAGEFTSMYSSSFGGRVENVSISTDLNLSGAANTTCVDNGLAVHYAFPVLEKAGQSVSKMIALAVISVESNKYSAAVNTIRLHTYFSNLLVSDIPPPNISSPISVQFVANSFSELEGDVTHTAGSIKVKVGKGGTGDGIVRYDQTVGLTVTGGSAVQNTDFSYQNAFIVPAGDYSTEKIITIDNISILGNLIPQNNRTMNLRLDGAECNDLIQLGTQNAATYTIIDDDKPTVKLSKIADIKSCGTSTSIFSIILDKAISSPVNVRLNMTGSAPSSDFSGMSPTNWYNSNTPSITIPANTSKVNVALTAKSSSVGKIVNARITSAVTNSLDLPIAVNPSDRVSISLMDEFVLEGGLAGSVCSGSLYARTLTSSMAGVGFSWSRAKVSGVTPASGAGTEASISETLTNSTDSPIEVTYNVTLSVNGCSNTQAIKVTVNPVPAKPTVAVEGSTSICAGRNVVLTATSATATTYQWYKGASGSETLIEGETAQTLDVTTSGTYSVKVRNASGCWSSFSTPTTITVRPALTAPTIGIAVGDNPFCEGGAITLRSSKSGSSYRWYRGGDLIPNANTRDLTVSEAGSYMLDYIDSNGCVSPQSGAYTVNVRPQPTAIISGSRTICATSDPTSLNIQLAGSTKLPSSTSPWTVSYTDGVTTYTINNIQTNNYTLGNLHPATTTTYTITNVTDANGCSNLGTGAGTVYVQPCGFGEPVMVWLRADEGISLQDGKVLRWADQSGSNSVLQEATTISQAVTLHQQSFNHNLAVVFDGEASHFMAGTVRNDFPSLYTMFAVCRSDGLATTPARRGVFTTRSTTEVLPGGNPGPGLVYHADNYYAMDGMLASQSNTASTYGMTGADRPSIVSGVAQTLGSTLDAQMYLNGVLNNNPFAETTTVLTNARRFEVGGRSTELSSMSATFQGQIAEILFLSATLTPNDRIKVESYLGLKYGISLQHEYVAANGATVWGQLINNGYNNDIAGIARDMSGYSLDQRVSHCENPGTDIVSIAHGKRYVDDQAQAKPIAVDGSYFIWGRNTAAASFQTTPADNRYQFSRVWRVQRTGTGIDTLSMRFNMSGVTLPVPGSSVTLLVSSTSNFAPSSILHSATASIVGGQLTFEGLMPIPNGAYFTLAVPDTTLAGIVGMSLWLKADVGVTGQSPVTSWADQSVNADIYTAHNNPILYNNVTDNLNFNPLLRLGSNGNDYLSGHTSIRLGHTFVVGRYSISGAAAASKSGAMLANAQGAGYLFRDMPDVAGLGFHGQLASPLYNYAAKPAGYHLMAYKSIGASGFNSYFQNGQRQSLSGDNTVVTSSHAVWRVGAVGEPAADYLRGDIAEIIAYSDTLDTEAKRSVVESYLAVKYGIAKVGNYLNSAHATTWDQSYNSAFRSHIAGIGRDDDFGLNQTISHNVQPGGDMLTVAHGSSFPSGTIHAQSGAVFGSNISHLLWASNNAPATFGTPAQTLVGNRLFLLDRKWLVQKTGSGVGAVSLQFDTTGSRMQIPQLAGGCGRLVLIASSNAMFTSASMLGSAERISASGKLTFDNVSLGHNSYFTLAYVAVRAQIIGNEQATCDTSATMQFPLEASLAPGETGQWSLMSITGGASTGVVINNPNAANTYAVLPVQGSTDNVVAMFRWRVTNTLTACTDSAFVRMTRYAKPVPPHEVVTKLEYCVGEAASPLQATASAGLALRWFEWANGSWLDLGDNVPTPNTSIEGTTNYRVRQGSDATGCESADMPIEVIVRPGLSDYPDIRIKVCPRPGHDVHLSSYLDTTYLQRVTWARETMESPPLSNTERGTIPTGGMYQGIHIYNYAVSNFCYPEDKIRRLYLFAVNGTDAGKLTDTLVVCRWMVQTMNLNQVLGLEATGTWSSDHAGDYVHPFVDLVSPPSIYAGVRILNSEQAYTALQSTAHMKGYKTDPTAVHLSLEYAPKAGTCLAGQVKRLVVIVANTL